MLQAPIESDAALFEPDWSAFAERFTSEELQQLRLYVELTDELVASTFLSNRQRLSVKASLEESYERFDHAGKDALRSMATTFRQLWDSKEKPSFQKTRGLLRSRIAPIYPDSDALVVLDSLGKRFKVVSKKSRMAFVDPEAPMDDTKWIHVRAHRVVDDWLYGVVLHSDVDKAARVRVWSPVGYEFSVAKSIVAYTNVMVRLRVAVSGVLDS